MRSGRLKRDGVELKADGVLGPAFARVCSVLLFPLCWGRSHGRMAGRKEAAVVAWP